MSRQLSLAVIVYSLATMVSASEPVVETPRTSPPPVSIESDEGSEVLLHEWQRPQPFFESKDASPIQTLADEVSFDSAEGTYFGPIQAPSGGSSSNCNNSFHCVHQVECGICNLLDCDCECQCESTCCTTDCWTCHPCQCSQGNCYRNECGEWVSNDSFCDVWGTEPQIMDAVRFGWWGVSSEGSQVKTGEFQDLDSSPFWDLDTILSNGQETLDLAVTGLDNEANDARAVYYGPNGGKANVHFQRFLRRLDHDPPAGFQAIPPGPPDPGPADDVVTSDMNIGDDYAIRVDQLDARFSGRVTDNVKWRLNVWGMRKFGERQANATAHCFNFNAPGANGPNDLVCHVLSQRQSIDWTTMEIQPVVEAQLANVTVEYSRTMRSFGQSDQFIDRQYSRFGFTPADNTLGPDFVYAITPENYTQIDRLKASSQLDDSNRLYANLFMGDTHNEFRDTERQFNGWDVRLTNTAREDLTVTAFTSQNEENNSVPTTFFSGAPLAPATGYDQASIRHPVNYQRSRAGLNGRWRPYYDESSMWRYLSWNAGYEYYLISRDFATYDSQRLGIFAQPDTNTHQIELGPSMRWSSEFTSFVRYKMALTDVPLIGVRESNGRFNTNQPEEQHWVDLGGTWTPSSDFMATAQFSFVNSAHDSHFARFSENSYPFNLSAWYAATERLSLSGGYAYSANWIDQNIAIGFRTAPFESTPWEYQGENHLVSFNVNYALTSTVQLTGGYEYDRGTNVFSVPPSPAGADWSQLPGFSDVVVETNRLSAGSDWRPYNNFDLYFRYIFFDYNDIGAGVDSGTAHMALAGATISR